MDRFVLDFYCADHRLAVEVDGRIHDGLRVADEERQTILESMGIRFVRLAADAVERDLATALTAIESAVHSYPSPLTRERGRAQRGGEG